MYIFTSLNNKKYRTFVTLPGGRVEPVRFEPKAYFGGVDESLYITSDSEIVKALQKHPAYGIAFLRKEEPGQPGAVLPPVEGTDLYALLPDAEKAVQAEGVASAAKARVWLQANTGYVAPASLSKDELKAEAARRGILFPDWS